MFNFENQIYALLNDEPFFAAFSRRINKREKYSPYISIDSSLSREDLLSKLSQIGSVILEEDNLSAKFQNPRDTLAVLSLNSTDLKITPSPTLGVRIDERGYFLLEYNPAYLASLSPNERTGALMHEYYHCILLHLTSRCPFPFRESAKFQTEFLMWNYATDLAINSLIPSKRINEDWLLPGRNPLSGLSPAQLAKRSESEIAIAKLIESFPLGKESEWYYAELKKMKKEFSSLTEKTCTIQFDDHGGWSIGGDLNDEEHEAAKEMAKAVLKEALEKAAQEAASQSWGSVSEDMKKHILEFIEGTIDWKKVLAWFCNSSIKAEQYNSIRKINKRYPYIHAGKRSTRTAKIAISIDQSGSVSDKLLADFYGELDSLSRIVEFTVIPFDAEVSEKDIFVWKKNERRTWERFLQGGTNFSAPTRYVNDSNKFDGHIILTDMCAERPIPSRVPRIWITNEEGSKHPVFDTSPERMVVIKK